MSRHSTLGAALLCLCAATPLAAQPASPLTFAQVKAYPFPNELTAAATGSRIVWAMNEQGLRNLYGAEGPAFTPRRLTSYLRDDGQELSAVSLSSDGRRVVFIRGGDFGSNWERDVPVNPTFDPVPPRVQIWSLPFDGGTFRFEHRLLFIANSRTRHHIGLEETADGIWSIYFNTVLLAKLDERDYILRG